MRQQRESINGERTQEVREIGEKKDTPLDRVSEQFFRQAWHPASS